MDKLIFWYIFFQSVFFMMEPYTLFLAYLLYLTMILATFSYFIYKFSLTLLKWLHHFPLCCCAMV
jgi:hypothetical protein